MRAAPTRGPARTRARRRQFNQVPVHDPRSRCARSPRPRSRGAKSELEPARPAEAEDWAGPRHVLTMTIMTVRSFVHLFAEPGVEARGPGRVLRTAGGDARRAILERSGARFCREFKLRKTGRILFFVHKKVLRFNKVYVAFVRTVSKTKLRSYFFETLRYDAFTSQ